MEKTIKIAGWTILGLLSLAMGFLLIARFTPSLLVNILGTHGRPGQLVKICTCSPNTILIEEIIDNDSGIGVEGGAGFSVQLKKLVLVNPELRQTRKIGLQVNTQVIACSAASIWLFDPGKGIRALATPNGKKQIDQEKLLKLNPALEGRLSGTPQDFSLNAKNEQLLIEDVESRYWQLDKNFRAIPLRSKPAATKETVAANAFSTLGDEPAFHPILLQQTEKSRLILHYKNKLRDGLRLTLMTEDGPELWQQNFDQLLDRKQEKCRPVALYQQANTFLLILDTSRGSRLIWIDKKTGRCLKNQRV